MRSFKHAEVKKKLMLWGAIFFDSEKFFLHKYKKKTVSTMKY